MLGSPIAHSLSPVLHRAAYADLGLEDWHYEAIEVADVAGLRAVLAEPWAGLSLTMPLKRLVLPLLDEVSDLARDVGVVNTVTFGRRRRFGHNTDVHGIVAALAEGGVTTLSPGASCVLGGGATAASALAALSALGDPAPVVVARDLARAGDVRAAATRLGATPRLVTWGEAAPHVRAASVVVSTVPASAHVGVVALMPRVASGVLLDVVYDPWPTSAALAWRAAGGTAIGGFVLLLHQAAAQVHLMTGHDPSVEVMRSAGLEALRPASGSASQ